MIMPFSTSGKKPQGPVRPAWTSDARWRVADVAYRDDDPSIYLEQSLNDEYEEGHRPYMPRPPPRRAAAKRPKKRATMARSDRRYRRDMGRRLPS